MDNTLLSINKEKNFAFHEVLTDSDNAVKDLARILSLGVESEEIIDETGTIVKPAAPVIDKCWEIVYPKADRTLFPEIEDWNKLLPDEYKAVTSNKIANIKDTVILKTKTIPKDIRVNNSTAMGVNQDLNMSSLTMYLEIYMPEYLADSETEDPIMQRDGYIPEVNDVNGVATGNKRIARNYHHLFMRIFDNINEPGDGPAENEIDPVTRDVIKWNSRSSCWSKLSWYTDFENVFKSSLPGGNSENGMLDGIVRIPVTSGLTSESKIKLWANVNTSRIVLGCMGSPNVDFSDNRYLIGCAYVGQIDSFDFSLNDTAGNFGLFTTSSSSPAMTKAEVKTRPSVPAVVSGSNITAGTTAGSATQIPFLSGLSVFNPGNKTELDALEMTSIPKTASTSSTWGNRYVDTSTVKIALSFDRAVEKIAYTDENGLRVFKNFSAPISFTLNPKVTVNPKDKKKVKIALHVDDIVKFLGGIDATGLLKSSAITFYNANGLSNPTEDQCVACKLNATYSFFYYTEFSEQTPAVKRDLFGNVINVNFDKTYGKNTANGVSDFSMYATFTKDYFQKHYFMFAATEEFMQKELYGKSAYTGEYFADRIKIVHSSEGPRGILSGMITIDTSSLHPFDELIVNKGFEKYQDKPEELFVYIPVTSPYCPFSNSTNGRHGIGILKDIRYPIPVTDEEIVKFAINELERKYSDLDHVTDDFALISSSQYGASINWTSTDSLLIEIE